MRVLCERCVCAFITETRPLSGTATTNTTTYTYTHTTHQRVQYSWVILELYNNCIYIRFNTISSTVLLNWVRLFKNRVHPPPLCGYFRQLSRQLFENYNYAYIYSIIRSYVTRVKKNMGASLQTILCTHCLIKHD